MPINKAVRAVFSFDKFKFSFNRFKFNFSVFIYSFSKLKFNFSRFIYNKIAPFIKRMGESEKSGSLFL